MSGPSAKSEQAERREIIKGSNPSRAPSPSTMFAMANLDTGITP